MSVFSLTEPCSNASGITVSLLAARKTTPEVHRELFLENDGLRHNQVTMFLPRISTKTLVELNENEFFY